MSKVENLLGDLNYKRQRYEKASEIFEWYLSKHPEELIKRNTLFEELDTCIDPMRAIEIEQNLDQMIDYLIVEQPLLTLKDEIDTILDCLVDTIPTN